ncbi:hypothetical protein GDO86_019164 [Hymenochirus boettgeri]|uniref:G-protein coupled receptors family 1 profile domain-containing protein n=1 Tax=Hymenochirus boettgeri TaxID=247094 RepID=A0A8T2IF71_9PIPI|nr:hypothetical protein GDO86_019164 [Hymenochirus boettgeri]
MYNVTTTFILLGIVEMERFRYLFCALSLIIYFATLKFNIVITLVVFLDKSLHEPMYILIASLMVNGIFGSSFFLKLNRLVFSSKVITRLGCFIQSFCIMSFSYSEITMFSIMAYDTFLAVCHPLHYHSLITSRKLPILICGSLLLNVTLVSSALILSAILPLCGTYIYTVYCDNTAIFILSCVDVSVNKMYGNFNFIGYLTLNISIIVYCYMRIFLICLKVSKDAFKRSIHTLVTHFLNLSVFLMGIVFMFVRSRLGDINLHLGFHIIFSISSLVFPPLLNPLIYGIRTKALKVKVSHQLQNIKKFTPF